MAKKKGLKLGIALGAGGARGFVHIGILKVLHENKIFPDYIAGTSMGAVIGAAYAIGRTPEEIETLAKTTNWRDIVDFTAPKLGLIKGKRVERKLREMIFAKKFKHLLMPISIVSYNLSKEERVVFTKGDLTQALRASISIPGFFNPVKLKGDLFVDGAVGDPTPFDVVRDMGADIVLAVDLYSKKEKLSTHHAPEQESTLADLKNKFIEQQLIFLKHALFPRRWPKLARKILTWLFDKILYPARVLRMLAGQEPLPITRIMYKTVNILTNNLARERLHCANVDVLITPQFDGMRWTDFAQAADFIRIGEKAMTEKLPELRKLLRK